MGVKEQVEAIAREISPTMRLIGEKKSWWEDSRRVNYLTGARRIPPEFIQYSSLLGKPLKEWLTMVPDADPILWLYGHGYKGTTIRITLSSDEECTHQLQVYGTVIPKADGILSVDILPLTEHSIGCYKPPYLSRAELRCRKELQEYTDRVGNIEIAQQVVHFAEEAVRFSTPINPRR
ncbi:MAG: hypothetical protein AAB414_04660 [Patescibacteria group bacterium]